MEHVVQIGVNVDDDAIQQAVINQASKLVAEKIEDTIFKKDYYKRVAGFFDAAVRRRQNIFRILTGIQNGLRTYDDV